LPKRGADDYRRTDGRRFGVPEVTTLPLLLFRASMEGNYQIASSTALILLIPSSASCC